MDAERRWRESDGLQRSADCGHRSHSEHRGDRILRFKTSVVFFGGPARSPGQAIRKFPALLSRYVGAGQKQYRDQDHGPDAVVGNAQLGERVLPELQIKLADALLERFILRTLPQFIVQPDQFGGLHQPGHLALRLIEQ